MQVKNLVSAGGVVYRRQGDQIDILLGGLLKPKIWALPKGGINTEESPKEAALREVSEETGLKVHAEVELGTIAYWFVREGARCHKTVHFYLMSPEDGSIEDHDKEFDEVRWFPSAEALESMTYENERNMVIRALEVLATSWGRADDNDSRA